MLGKFRPSGNATHGGGGLFGDGTSSAAASEMTGMSDSALKRMETGRLGALDDDVIVQPVVTTKIDTKICFTPTKQRNTPLFVDMKMVADAMIRTNKLPPNDGGRSSRVESSDLVRRIAVTVWNPSPFTFIAQLNLKRRSDILQIDACVGSPHTQMTGHILVPARMPAPVKTTIFLLDGDKLDPTFIARNYPGYTLARLRADLDAAKSGFNDCVQLPSNHPIVGYIDEQIKYFAKGENPAKAKMSPEDYIADRRSALLSTKKDPRSRANVRTLDVLKSTAEATYQVLAEDELRYITVDALRVVNLPSDVHRVDTSEERKVMLQFFRAHPTEHGEFNVDAVDEEIAPFVAANGDGRSSAALYDRLYLINVTFEIDTQAPPQKISRK